MKSLSSDELIGLLALVEQAHEAKTQHQFRQILVHGIGSLIESTSCVWTEFGIGLFAQKKVQISVADTSDENMEVDHLVPLFNTYAYQHPVIAHILETGDKGANAISDKLNHQVFAKLELYELFYKQQDIEDQMSIGYVEQGQVKGLSIHRNFWGFSEKERQLANRIADCTFSYYRALPSDSQDEAGGEPVVQVNAIDLPLHHDLLGITKRQAEILSHVARGQSNKQIASVLHLSEGTVRKHLENCFRRLGVNNRVSAMTESIALIEKNSAVPLTRQTSVKVN